MRTTVEIDELLMDEALQLSGLHTKRAVVDLALRELIARRGQLGFLDLGGRVHWNGDLEESRQGGRDGRVPDVLDGDAAR